MPISGPVVHQQLMDAYANMQADLESERGQILQTKEQRDALGDDRSEALVVLAEHYLPELTPDAIRQTWSEIRHSLSQLLERKEAEVRQLQSRLDELSDRRAELEQQLVAISRELDEAVEAQQAVATEVERELQNDQRFVQLSDRAAVAEASIERAEANLQEIDQDSARKLPAYDDSALFRYLLERDYGTPNYTHRGFTRRMDRWVAKLIDFNQAKQGYDFLRKTPEQMRQIIAEDRQSLDTVMEELERIRDEFAVKLGLPEKIRQVEASTRQRDEQLQLLDALLAETEQTQNERGALDDTRGPYYRQAIQMFRDMLDQFDSDDLKRRAQQTREITDDQIVARLMGVETEIDQLDESARRRRNQLDQMRAFLEDLGRLVQRFRAAEFDSSRSQFVGSLDIHEEVEQARLSGNIDSVWQRIRNAQRWGPTVIEQVTRVASHPLTQVLINAMAHAAGGALEAHARRAGHRRSSRTSSRGGSWRGW